MAYLLLIFSLSRFTRVWGRRRRREMGTATEKDHIKIKCASVWNRAKERKQQKE